ncbi:MAG: hypothetical protein ABSA02_42270 [Trebonia sp.]
MPAAEARGHGQPPLPAAGPVPDDGSPGVDEWAGDGIGWLTGTPSGASTL